MIDTQALRKKVLDLAIRGKLTKQLPEDGTAEELYAKIQEEKQTLIKEGKIKKEKDRSKNSIFNDQPFEIPENWKFVRFGNLMINRDSERIPISVADRRKRAKVYDYYGASGIIDQIDSFLFDKDLLLIAEDGANLIARSTPVAFIARGKYWVNNHAHVLDVCHGVNLKYICYYINSISLAIYVTGMAQPKMNQENMNAIWISLPPFAEQKRIVEKIESIFSVLDKIDSLQSEYSNNLSALKTKIIEAGIRGKLTEQLPEDGTAEELFKKIQQERKRQIEIGIIKRVDLLPELVDSEMAFQVPDSWKWFPLGNISYIVRGGSPRPIKQYITADENGVNWIKIGDVEKGGKYIYATEEKIRPEGEKKSRRVYPGDFLLTNSMSFGRPYITKIEGCIHDGWLLIRNLDGFDIDYLYYLLSSQFLFNQFSDKASGSTVTNLNIDKVKSAAIPLPPLAEQKRIVAMLDAVLSILDSRQ